MSQRMKNHSCYQIQRGWGLFLHSLWIQEQLILDVQSSCGKHARKWKFSTKIKFKAVGSRGCGDFPHCGGRLWTPSTTPPFPSMSDPRLSNLILTSRRISLYSLQPFQMIQRLERLWSSEGLQLGSTHSKLSLFKDWTLFISKSFLRM